MTDPNADWIFRLYETDPSVSHFTEKKLRAALSGYPLTPVRSYAWLASAVRWATHTGLRFANSQADRKSVAKVRDELGSLSEEVRSVWLRLNAISSEADAAMWNFSFRRWVQSDDTEAGMTMDEGSDSERLKALRGELAWLGHFLSDVAGDLDTKVPARKWITAERKRLRIFLAWHLSPVFEEAFGLETTHKNAGSNHQPRSFGHWADFLDRILSEVGIAGASLNMGEVLRDSRSLHLNNPVLFEARNFDE